MGARIAGSIPARLVGSKDQRAVAKGTARVMFHPTLVAARHSSPWFEFGANASRTTSGCRGSIPQPGNRSWLCLASLVAFYFVF